MVLDMSNKLRKVDQQEKSLHLLQTGLQLAEKHPELLEQAIELSIENRSSVQLEEQLIHYLALRKPDKAFASRALKAVQNAIYERGETDEDNPLIAQLKSIIND